MGTWVYLGIMSYVAQTQLENHIPVYRAWNGRDHFYTTDYNEYENLPSTFTKMGVKFYILDVETGDNLSGEPTVLHPNVIRGHTRMVAGRAGPVERATLYSRYPRARAYEQISSAAVLALSGFPDPHIPFYRLYNSTDDNHFYCTSIGDVDFFVDDLNYINEGIVGYVGTSPGKNADHSPLFYAYHPEIVDHFYTTNMQEIENVVPRITDTRAEDLIEWKLKDFLHDDYKVFFADNEYHTPTKKISREIIRQSKVDQRAYISEKHDCDDFAHLLKSAFIEAAYNEGTRTLPYALGVMWGATPAHAINFIITSSGYTDSYDLLPIEPQDGVFTWPPPDDIYLLIM